jgi:TatD DNase family protein
MSSIAYQLGNSLYLNITNRCLNHCDFCIRYKARIFHKEYPLWLSKEPTAGEILEAIGDPQKFEEIVFCGYGEPLIRLETVKEVAKALRPSGIKIRVDTNGQANLFYGRNILPELKGLVDEISISFNAENAKKYDSICHSTYGEKAYGAIMDFIQKAKDQIPKVTMTVVDLPGLDKEACRKIAEELGANFRIRPYYEELYPEVKK